MVKTNSKWQLWVVLGFLLAGTAVAGDIDSDGIDDSIDNCVYVYNPGQEDIGPNFLANGIGDACECVEPFLVFTGEQNTQLGWSISGAGDVNNDGFDDLIVGLRGRVSATFGAGSVRVYSGATGGLLHTFIGEADNDSFGFSVSGAGDVNNDGFADLIIGTPLNDAGGKRAGRAYVYSGASGDLLYTFTGEAAGDDFGFCVSGAGDVNNDGFADLIVGAYLTDSVASDAGSAYVYSGATGQLLYKFDGNSTQEGFGRSVSGAGDVNGDGFADVIVGAPFNGAGGFLAGRVFVYSGATGAQLFAPVGEPGFDFYAFSVSGAGDVNGDGFDDVIVGASQKQTSAADTSAGRVYVYSGPSGALLYTITSHNKGEGFGYSVSDAGDINNDGFADVVVGVQNVNINGGLFSERVYVYSGANGSLMHVFNGESAANFFGQSVSGAGDVNGDGFPDLVVGAHLNNAGGTEAGRMYVYSLADPDSDFIPTSCDNCPAIPNPDQLDSNDNGLGDVCDCCDKAGDANDDGSVNIADVTFLIARIFAGGPAPACPDAGDANGNNKVNIADITYLIARIFAGGSAPVCGTTGL